MIRRRDTSVGCFLRSVLAATFTFLLTGIPFQLLVGRHADLFVLDVLEAALDSGWPPRVVPILLTTGEAMTWIPALLLGLCAFRLSWKPPATDHAYCGRCGYILKGLANVQCPECGTRL